MQIAPPVKWISLRIELAPLPPIILIMHCSRAEQVFVNEHTPAKFQYRKSISFDRDRQNVDVCNLNLFDENTTLKINSKLKKSIFKHGLLLHSSKTAMMQILMQKKTR